LLIDLWHSEPLLWHSDSVLLPTVMLSCAKQCCAECLTCKSVSRTIYVFPSYYILKQTLPQQ